MTIIKQKSVTESIHAKSLRNYINNKDALARDFQNIINPARWSDEMARLRKACGHDAPARAGCKNTILRHQILAFLPEEADINGGPMTPEKCMEYAREYAAARYPDFQIAFALHKEHCREDRTYRYAVHMAVNVSSLKDGNRLNEGLSYKAKRDRAAFVRQMDKRWGLQQVEEGTENSKIHKRQPQRIGVEKQIIDRAEKQGQAPEEASYKYNLRKLCQGLRKRAGSMEEYRNLLAEWGVETEIRDGKLYATDTDHKQYSFRVSRLDKALEENMLLAAFHRNEGDRRMARMEAEVKETMQRLTDRDAMRKAYLDTVKQCYQKYRRQAEKQKGTSLAAFPQIRIPRIPESLAKDAQVRREVVNTIRRSDELRERLAGEGPMGQAGKTGKEAAQQIRKQEQQAQAPRNRQRGRE